MAGFSRRLPPKTDIIAFLLSLPAAARMMALAQLGPVEREALDRAWASWAHSGQAAPPGDWRTWVIMAGRGFGKTLAGAQWIRHAAAGQARLRIALVAATLDEARDDRGRKRADGGRRRRDRRLVPKPAAAALQKRVRSHLILRRLARNAARSPTSFRLVRRARQMGKGAGKLAHAPARPAPGRPTARARHHYAKAGAAAAIDHGERAHDHHRRADHGQPASVARLYRQRHRTVRRHAPRPPGVGRRTAQR